MTERHFYHITRSTVDRVLPDLLEKTLAKPWRAVVLCGSAKLAEQMADWLWVYKPEGFLPHGTEKDGNAEHQPIWLTHKPERPNNADVLFLLDNTDTEDTADYQRVCHVFDGTDAAATEAVRQSWKAAQARGDTVIYWQQTEQGWERKAG